MPDVPAGPILVGLGGNLDGPARRVAGAAQRLAAWPGVTALRCSRLYRSAPWGRADQPEFVNAVVAFDYAGSPQGLLDGLLAIEREAGRVRTAERWGPRRLDLDLLDFAGMAIDTPTLSLPHPRIAQRAFVLLPLAELAPELRLADGRSVRAHAGAIDAAGVAALD